MPVEPVDAIAPVVRFFWEGHWAGGMIELRRKIYDCELVFVSSGRAELDIAGTKHTLSAGSIAIIPPATPHQTYIPIGSDVTRHCIHFDWAPGHERREAPLWTWHEDRFHAGAVHRPPAHIAACLPIVVDASSARLVIDALQLAFCFFRDRDPLAPRQLAVVLEWVLATARTQATRPAEATDDARGRLVRLLQHIDEHFSDPLTHHDFCRLTGMSSTKLCRLFRDVVGMRPLAYLHQVRIRGAQRMLVEQDARVADIAQQVGFADANYFCRVFRRELGMSPGVFRQRGKETLELYRQSADLPQDKSD